MRPAVLLLLLSAQTLTLSAQNPAAWKARAQRVTITRDTWGIPHVQGKTDADVVFGLMYAQAEDDFPRIETNYLNALGRLAEAEGPAAIPKDLRMKLFIDPARLKVLYRQAPAWLRNLMDAWAEGLNYYLHTHPQVSPRVIKRFEPWMALSFSEGSIGGDIEKISLTQLEAFYGKAQDRNPRVTRSERGAEGPLKALPEALAATEPEPPAYAEPTGSNGIAIAPSHTAGGKALLLINPHTSFFFRAEAQMTSQEGLNAYGALTWGQFFIYQGFNARVGWMHTSSTVDNVDEYLETVVTRGGKPYYRHGGKERPVQVQRIAVPYRTPGGMAEKVFSVYRTHHGPVVREVDGKWVSVRLMEEPLKALRQSYGRTKARNLKEFRESLALHTNSSNNTIYADAEGNIAYFHANFVPRRDPRFDWTRPVDGSDPATDWKGVHGVEDSPLVLNPRNGWLYNTNNFPWSAAGADSPKRTDFPGYMDAGSENPRGIHAMKVLEGRRDFTLESLLAAAYDSLLPAFQASLPPLVQAWEALPGDHPRKAALAEPIALLRAWDCRWDIGSVPTTLAVFWGEEAARGRKGSGPEVQLEALATALERLTRDFGTWKTPWGEVNRFQRLTGELVHPFNDAAPSLPVGFTSARWGSLASFGATRHPGTKRLYGTTGNSFVAVVEFGPRVRARAISAGGQSGDPASPHFNDQAPRYVVGDLREVLFYPEQLKGQVKRTYHPGA